MKNGRLIVFDDVSCQAINAVVRFVLANRDYELVEVLEFPRTGIVGICPFSSAPENCAGYAKRAPLLRFLKIVVLNRTTEKWNATVGPEAAAAFQSLYEWVRVVHGFNKNHGHPCRPLTNRYVLVCAQRWIVLAGKKVAFNQGVRSREQIRLLVLGGSRMRANGPSRASQAPSLLDRDYTAALSAEQRRRSHGARVAVGVHRRPGMVSILVWWQCPAGLGD